MLARFFYPGKTRPRTIWGFPGPFFAWAGKIQKLSKFWLFSLVGPFLPASSGFYRQVLQVMQWAADTYRMWQGSNQAT